MRKSLVINGCLLGKRISGIERFAIEIIKRLPLYYESLDKSIGEVLIYSNYNFKLGRNIYSNFEVKPCIKFLSSDFKYGNMLRFLWNNILPVKHSASIIVTFSQIDGILNPIKRGNKIITFIHDVIPLQFKLGKSFLYYKYILPFIIKNSDLIITVSNHSKKLIQQYFAPSQPIEVIYPGIAANFKFLNFKREPFILYVGRLARTKNLDRLLLAFRRLKQDESFKDYELWIVGAGSSDWILQYIDSDVKNSVKILENVSDEELVNLYNKASLFVFPSLYEGFGFPPLEAMACGCPVVVSKTGSLPEVCGDAAYYIDPLDVESIYKGIYEVLTNKSLRNSLVKKGLVHIKKYKWDTSIKKFISLVNMLT